MKFKILRGLHRDGKKLYGPDQPDGDLFESDADLCVRFNSPGAIKFERLPDEYPFPTEKKRKPAKKSPQEPAQESLQGAAQ